MTPGLIVLLIVYIVVLAAWNLLFKINKKPTLQSMYVISFWGIILALVAFGINFIFVDNPFRNLTWPIVGFIALRALIGISTLFCWIKAMKYIHISIADPVFLARLFPLLAIGWLVFDDVVSVVAIVLTIVIFVTCLVLGFTQYKFEKDKSKNYLRGLFWLVVCMCFSIPNAFLTRYIAGFGIDVVVFILIALACSFLYNNVIQFATRQNPIKTLRGAWKDKVLFAASIPDNFWMLFWIPLALNMNIGVLDAILVAGTVLTILGGIILLKERVPKIAFIFMAIILGCAIALSIITAF